jgi:hypothetical protein
MRQLIADIGLVLFVLIWLGVIIKPFENSNTSIKSSVWSKLAVYYCVFIIIVAQVDSYLRFGIDLKKEINYLILSSLIVSYFLYLVLMFRYEVTDEKIVWFNGFWLKRVIVKRILSVTFIKKSNQIRRIEFITADGIIKMRNDLGLEMSIQNLCANNAISCYTNIQK